MTVPVGLNVKDAVPDGDLLIVGEAESERVPVGETVEVTDGVIVCVDGVLVPVIEPVVVTDDVAETDGDLEPVGLTDIVRLPDVDGVPDPEREPVTLTVPDPVLVGDLVAADLVAEIVLVPDTDGELDTVALPDSLGEPEGE